MHIRLFHIAIIWMVCIVLSATDASLWALAPESGFSRVRVEQGTGEGTGGSEDASSNVLPFADIHVSHIRLKAQDIYTDWVLKHPQTHLIKCQKGRGLTARFRRANPQTTALMFNVAHCTDSEGEMVDLLAVSEVGGADRKVLATWVMLDDTGRPIALEHHKHSTLPAQFMADDMYEQLAPFTYAFDERPLRFPGELEELSFAFEGHEWIEMPPKSAVEMREEKIRGLLENSLAATSLPKGLSEALRRGVNGLSKYLAQIYPQQGPEHVRWIGPAEAVTQEMVDQLEAGWDFFYVGSFQRGQKFYYDLARKLRGPPAEARARLARIHGIRILASSQMNSEFSHILSARGQVAFRFSDLLFWEKHGIRGVPYTFEHVHSQDAQEIQAMNNKAMEPELHMSLRQVQEWIAVNPRTLVARDSQGRIGGCIFVSLLKLANLPWTHRQMARAHDPIHQDARDTMVDFWVLGNLKTRGVGRLLPSITRDMARWMGPNIRYLIAYSRPAELEEALIRDEFERNTPGDSWPNYLESRRAQNRSRRQVNPALPYTALFEPGIDIARYIEERFLFLTHPGAYAIKDKETGQTISYDEYRALWKEYPDTLRCFPGLEDSRESWEILTAPRGLDAYERFKTLYDQKHPGKDLTIAEFCRLTGRIPEARVLIGVHETRGAQRSGIFFEGRPEDFRALGYNYLMFFLGNPADLMRVTKVPNLQQAVSAQEIIAASP